MALVFRIIVNKKKSVTYCQQVLFIVKAFCVHKVFIALFVEYPLCFLSCHNLRLHVLKIYSIGKTVLSVSCARFKSHICKLRPPPPPTVRPRNTCICPCMSRRRRSTQISRLCPFSSRRQAEWTPVQASCSTYIVTLQCRLYIGAIFHFKLMKHQRHAAITSSYSKILNQYTWIKLKQSDNICVLLTWQLTDLATEIIKCANLRTHIRKIIDSYFE